MEVVATQSVMTVERNGIVEIIVLSGFARSGKDEAAKVLVEEFGFRQVAYADKLREALYTLNPLVMEFRDNDRLGAQVYVQDVIRHFGWDGYKESPYGNEIRRLIQTMGTEVGRNMFGENIWVDATLAGIGDDDKVVISDGRFFNEFDAPRELGGHVWRIDRTGVGPANNHESETAAVDYPNFSLYLQNNGTLEEFRELVRNEYTRGRYREW